MKNEVSRMDFDMPLLRQTVLENKKRNDKNELMIDQMCKGSVDQARDAAAPGRVGGQEERVRSGSVSCTGMLEIYVLLPPKNNRRPING